MIFSNDLFISSVGICISSDSGLQIEDVRWPHAGSLKEPLKDILKTCVKLQICVGTEWVSSLNNYWFLLQFLIAAGQLEHLNCCHTFWPQCSLFHSARVSQHFRHNTGGVRTQAQLRPILIRMMLIIPVSTKLA